MEISRDWADDSNDVSQGDGDGDDIHTLLPPPYRLGAVDTHLISPVFLPFDIAKDRKIMDNIYQNPDFCVL